MKDVHLHRFHAVQIAPENLKRNEVSANVDHQSAPGKPRLILNLYGGGSEAVGRDFHQLQKSLQPVHRAERRGGLNFRAVWADFKRVRFILAQLLNLLARVIRVNRQSSFRRRLCRKRQPSLPRELPQESLHRAVEAGFAVAGQRNRK